MKQKDNTSFWENNIGQSGGMLSFQTNGVGFSNITHEVTHWLSKIGAKNGLFVIFVCHTSASLTIQENADPDVLLDLGDALDKVAPRNQKYRHSSEGPDDMPAHIRSMLTSTSLSIPVQNGRMVLGTWQGIFLAEHRDQPHTRRVALQFTGSQFMNI